jgi:hypothetical protein
MGRTADPVIDQLVAGYRHAHPGSPDARSLVMSMIAELSRAKSQPRQFIQGTGRTDGSWMAEALAVATAPRRWASDPALIARGQQVFAGYGLYQSAALFFASLPMAYATVDGAEALTRVSDLATHNLTRRVAETGQMLLDVMGLRGDGSLEPGGTGYATAVALRLMHACVRALVLDQPLPDEWPAERFGPPANQELMLGTLLDFSLVTWSALERMGIVLSERDREASIHTWSVVGDLMGVQACRDGPLTVADVEQIRTGMMRLLAPSEAGQRLMAALLAEMEDFMPLGWRKLPRSVVRWLFQGAPGPVGQVPDMLKVPPSAWWSAPLLAWAQDANQHSWLLGPLGRALIRKLGRVVVVSFADRYSDGPTPFRVPSGLARSWGIRLTAGPRRVRAVRRSVRHRARSAAWRRGRPARAEGQ